MIKRDLQRNIDLFVILVKKEITLKYKRTVLGLAWSLLNPVLMALVYYLAFSVFMRIKMENYALFLLSALFPWNWFSASVLMSVNTLTGNTDLIRKVVFPKHFLVLSLVAGQSVTMLFSIPVLAAILVFGGKMPGIEWLYGVPILIIIQFITLSGAAMAVSIVNVFFRDLEYIAGVFMTMLFWLTPVIYPLSAVPEKFRVLLAANPMLYLIESWRSLIMHNAINWQYIGFAFAASVMFLLAGIIIFKALEKKIDGVI
ncbi:MAG: ABC transporter permease [Candidatus Goldbacteria bacterium]|nr:ABC transporter permease [Candidatus Goldiibacteriota bacterium]